MDITSGTYEKSKYPKCVWFIVLNELCERFSYYGLRTVLVLYLTTVLKFNGDESTIIFHSFVFLAYFMPLVGAIVADSFLGKFQTIILFSIVYAFGNVVLTGAASAEDIFDLNYQKIVALLGLFFISVGTGGIKPCVFPFGGDQFRLPEQTSQLLHYTTKFTVAINLGALVSTFLTPELRHSVHCFHKNTCFPLAFGVPAVLMFVAVAIFVAGRNMYVKKKPEHNVISRTFGCIFYALRKKLTSSTPCRTHWLDNAKGVYTETEISDTRTALDLIVTFSAYPVFWALYEQQGSRWTLQGTLMNGRIDYLDWTIKPDQMQTLVPFFGMIFLVLFDVALYPLLAMIGIRKPLQKLTLSGFFAVVAFVIAALLQLKIFGNAIEIPPGEGRLNIYNAFDCNAFVRSPSLEVHQIGSLDKINVSYTPVTRETTVRIEIRFDPACPVVPENFQLNTTFSVAEKQEASYYLSRPNPETIALNRVGNYSSLIKDKYGNPSLRVILDYNFNFDDDLTFRRVDSSDVYRLSAFRGSGFSTVTVGKYELIYNGEMLPTTIDLIPATFYTLTVQRNNNKMDVKLFSMYEGNYIHILWQVPQYICMIMADVIFVVTGLEISFIEAPTNIKSFISAISLLTTALGNLLVVIISAISIKNQAHEYFLYSGLMFIDAFLLAYFSIVYRGKMTVKNNATKYLNENNKKEETTF